MQDVFVCHDPEKSHMEQTELEAAAAKARLPKPALVAPGYEPPKALLGSIRDELRRMLDDEAFDHSSLLTIGDFAQSAHALVMSHNPMAKIAGRRRGAYAYATNIGGMGEYYGGMPSDEQMPLALPNVTENVGVRVMKELAAMMRPKQGGSTVDLVRGLAEARKHGLDDVAASLEEELGIKREPETPENGAEAPGPTSAGGGFVTGAHP